MEAILKKSLVESPEFIKERVKQLAVMLKKRGEFLVESPLMNPAKGMVGGDTSKLRCVVRKENLDDGHISLCIVRNTD